MYHVCVWVIVGHRALLGVVPLRKLTKTWKIVIFGTRQTLRTTQNGSKMFWSVLPHVLGNVFGVCRGIYGLIGHHRGHQVEKSGETPKILPDLNAFRPLDDPNIDRFQIFLHFWQGSKLLTKISNIWKNRSIMARFRSILVKVKGEGGILVLRLRRKITITSRWSWRLKFWESEQLLKPERATGVPGVDSALKSSMTYPTIHGMLSMYHKIPLS